MISRMAPREKRTLGITAAVLVAVVTFYLVQFFINRHTRLRAELSKTTQMIETLRNREADRSKWVERDTWLRNKLDVLGDPDVANKALRELVLKTAMKYTVTIEKPTPGMPSKQTDYTSLSIGIEAAASWEAMFEFLRELQGPEKFIAIESCDLKVKPEDKTKLRASLTVAKWFAPK